MNERTKRETYCWASSHECRGKITKEHVVSKSILNHLGPLTHKTNNKEYKLGSASYVIRSLCEYHNKALSKCDNEALKLFSGWHSALKNKNHQKTIQVNTNLIEQWYAKTLYNSMIFRNKIRDKKIPIIGPSPHSIRQQLFNNKAFPPPFGIYMIDPKKESLVDKKSWWSMSAQFQTIWHRNGKTNLMTKGEMPTVYYTCLGGIEIVGLFNLTALSDEQALDSHLKAFRIKLTQDGIYRRDINFGTTHKSDPEYDGVNPTRIVEFI